MNTEQIIKELNAIFIDVLDNDSININIDTAAEDIDEWDSLSHIQLIVAIEKYFKIKFKSAEIHAWKNVGEMIESMKSKIVA